MTNRELTQLISTAKHYLDAADSVPLSPGDLASSVSANAASWPENRRPHPLPPLDIYSAHLASCATRLATIHEILVGGTEKAWTAAYPNGATVTAENLKFAATRAFEILLRDNVAHAEAPGNKGVPRSKFRKAALGGLTFSDMRECLGKRYEQLANELVAKPDA